MVGFSKSQRQWDGIAILCNSCIWYQDSPPNPFATIVNKTQFSKKFRGFLRFFGPPMCVKILWKVVSDPPRVYTCPGIVGCSFTQTSTFGSFFGTVCVNIGLDMTISLFVFVSGKIQEVTFCSPLPPPPYKIAKNDIFFETRRMGRKKEIKNLLFFFEIFIF